MMITSLESCGAHDDPPRLEVANDAVNAANVEETTETPSQSSAPNAVKQSGSSSVDRQRQQEEQQQQQQQQLRIINRDSDCNNSQQRRSAAIDSALRSALSDPRERLALLRCEQQFVLFLQDSSVVEITVGGAFNSIVVGLTNSPSAPADAGVGSYSSNGHASSRSTSFQRCWLHRLADRFGIVRETVNAEWINCKKTPASAVPTVLLSQLGTDSYHHSNSNEFEPTVTRSLSQLSLSSPATVGSKGMATASNKAAVPKRSNKMKIMKRDSSSSLGASSTGRNRSNASFGATLSDSDKSQPKRGTLPEKERAYAEARARIFNEGAAAASEATNGDVLEPSMVPTGSNLAKTPSFHSLSPSLSNTDQDNFDQNDPYNQRPRPAAATIGGISKVTWRNRQQEENDPDFQRGIMYNHAAPAVPDASYYYASATGGQHHNPNPYYYHPAQYQHQEWQPPQPHLDHLNTNPYAAQQQHQQQQQQGLYQHQEPYAVGGEPQMATAGQPAPTSGV